MRSAAWLLLLAALTVSGSDAKAPAHEEARRAVEPRDFFLYSCVREFTRAHALPLFDSSSGYAVEYSRMSPEEMGALYEAAKTFALTLRAPDLTDEEHGGVAVLALCLEEARSTRVDALLERERKAGE